MWQRFTERARRVVFFAQEEAARLGENYVGTEHLLLGLVRENDTVAARILDRLGVPLGRIRSDIERQVTRGHGNGAALQFEVELTDLDQLDQFRSRGVGSAQETGNWMHAFSEILAAPPCVEILRFEGAKAG